MLNIVISIILAHGIEILVSIIGTLGLIGICYVVAGKKEEARSEKKREIYLDYQRRLNNGEKLTDMEQIDYDLFSKKYL